jgi:amino acid transporter
MADMPITSSFADVPTDAPTPPPSYRFYWLALAIAVGALLFLVAVYGVRSGKGLEDAWMFANLLCLATLAISLAMLVPRSMRQRAGRVAVASALGLIVSFVGFGLAHDESKARMTAGQSRARPAAHGVALPGTAVIEDEATPSADERRR